MSTILAVFKRRGLNPRWIILDCGHWYKWSGDQRPPRVGTSMRCASCSAVVVVNPGAPHD